MPLGLLPPDLRAKEVLHRNASNVVRYFCLPRDRIVEVGSIIEI